MRTPLKTFFILALNVAVVNVSFAGTEDKFVIGVNAGPGLSYLYNYPRSSYTYYSPNQVSAGASIGLNCQYNISKIFSVQTGAYYTLVTVKRVDDNYSLYDEIGQSPVSGYYYSGNKYYSLNYITVPVLFRASFGKKVKFYVETGAYMSALPKPVNIYGDWGPVEFAQSFRQLDAGVAFGAGISVPLPHRVALNFEARNNVGLMNVINNVKTYSSVLLSGFTYTFGKKDNTK